MDMTLQPLIIEGCSATLHIPAGGVRRIVVMVNTFGYEGAYTVRAWTALGEDLARAGVALLRFDLPDQGDSRDLPPDADAASAWLDSVVDMVGWARGQVTATAAPPGTSSALHVPPAPSSQAAVKSRHSSPTSPA